MLDGMRKAAQTWLGKAVLTVMFSFLILSFAVWGIGDIFRGFGQGKLARAGDTDISAEDFRTEYQNQLQRLQQMTRQTITNEQARAYGLDQQVLGRLVSEALLDQRARELGLAMSDEAVAAAVFKDPEFFGPLGSYDRTTFLDKIRNAGMDERRFALKLRASYLRQELTGTLVAGLKLPQSMLEGIFRYANETRSVEYFVLTAKEAGEVTAPTPEVLAKYYEANKASYRAPEYRKFTTLALTPATVSDPSKVTEAEIAEIYERDKVKRFGTPETRQINQIVFKTGEESAAAEALAKIRAGAKFEEIAAARDLKPSDIDLGTVTADKLTDPAVSKAAFELKEGDTSEVIKGRFGPVLVQAVKVNVATIKPLSEVQDTIRKEIAAQRAQDDVARIQRVIEDQRTSGKELAEAAKGAGLTARVVEAADAQGRDKSGAPIKDLIEPETLLKAVFSSDIGVDNDTLTTRDRGYIWFEIAGIEPARERTLDEVRPLVEAAWQADQLSTRLRDKAEALVKEISGGKSIEDVAKELGLKADHAPDVKRAGHDKLASGVVERVFAIPVGSAGTALASADTRAVFKVLDAATPLYDPDNETIKAVLPQVQRAFSEDIAQQYLTQLQKEGGVAVNPVILRSATGATDTN